MIRVKLSSCQEISGKAPGRVYVGIVGHAADKFTPKTKSKAISIIEELLSPENSVLVSGHCHLGGIDIWAEEVARHLIVR